MNVAKHETYAIVEELRASQERLGLARHRIPPDLVPLQGLLLQNNVGNTARLGDGQVSRGITQRQYDEMRYALSQWEEGDPRFSPARERAFYGALRNLLMECLSETTEQAQSNRLKAAYRWFSRNVPIQRPDNLGEAAAAATSLSLARAAATTYSSQKELLGLNKMSEIHDSTVFQGKSNFYSVYSRDPDNSVAANNVCEYNPPHSSARPDLVNPDRTAKSTSQAPVKAVDDHSLLRSNGPSPLSLVSLSSTPEPHSLSPSKARQNLPIRNLLSDAERPLGQPLAKNRAAMLNANVNSLSSVLQRELRGLNDEDEELLGLRTRWRHSASQEGNWWKDINDCITRWSVHRARVEEEISRRQEAARYSAAVSSALTTTRHVMVQDGEERDPLRAASGSPSSMGGNSDGGGQKTSGSQHGDTQRCLYTVSPYTKLRVTDSYPAAPRTGQDILEDQKASLLQVQDAMQRRGNPISLVTLRRGLMPPPPKSAADCAKGLPKPGSAFEPSPQGKKPKAKHSSKSRSVSRGKKR